MLCLLTSCSTKPLVSAKGYVTHAFRADLEAWVAGEADSVIEASGIQEGWLQQFSDPPLYWGVDRNEVLSRTDIRDCLLTSGDMPRAMRLQLALEHEGSPDYMVVVEQIRALWVSAGWDVRDVVRPQDVPQSPYVLFRADRVDGTGVMLKADERVFRLTLFSACSDNATSRG